MNQLSSIWHSIQHTLFDWLEKELDPLTEKQKEFVAVVELAELDRHINPYRWKGVGRKPGYRLSLAKAFIAKAVYGFPTTDAMIEYLRDSKNLRRLCGWETRRAIPSVSAFSRAFAEFSEGELMMVVHKAMVNNHLGDKIAGHVNRDSTAIEGREKPVRKKSASAGPPKEA